MDKFSEITKKLDTLMVLVENNFRQVESLIAIYNTLDIIHPLPPSRGWAISPDFGVILMREILRHKPTLIVEVGGGLSTLIAGYCLKKIGGGKIISLDHNETFMKQTMENVSLHQLNSFVELIYAPLVNHTIDEKEWQWYDTTKLNNDSSIDMLIIDGPPAQTQADARYPALPLLYEKFNDNITIILDDAVRQGEKRIANLWVQEYPQFAGNYIYTEKGTITLKRTVGYTTAKEEIT